MDNFNHDQSLLDWNNKNELTPVGKNDEGEEEFIGTDKDWAKDGEPTYPEDLIN